MDVFQENALYNRLVRIKETIDSKGFLLTPYLEKPVDLEKPITPRKWTHRDAGGLNISQAHLFYGRAVVTELNAGVNLDAQLPISTSRFQTLEEFKKIYTMHACRLQSEGKIHQQLTMTVLEELISSYQQDGYLGYCGYFNKLKMGVGGMAMTVTMRNADNTALVYLQIECR